MKHHLAICLLISSTALATTLKQALFQEFSSQSSEEIILTEQAQKASISQAIGTASEYIPQASLYYSYTKPGSPSYNSPLNTANSNFPVRFITGLIQEQYGLSLEYNLFAIPQLVKKIQGIGLAKSLSNSQKVNKQSEFYYTLTETFLNLYKAKESYKLKQEIYQTAKTRATETTQLFEYGKISKADMLSTQSELLKAELEIQNQENILANALNQYQDKFSQTPPQQMELQEQNITEIAKNLEDLKEIIAQNHGISAIQKESDAYKIESQINKISLMPKVTVGYRQNFTNPDQSLSIPNYTQGTFSINANFNLLNIRSLFQAKQYHFNAQQKQIEAKVLLRQYLTEAEDLWKQVEYYTKLETVLEQVIKNTEETYIITKEEVKYGTKNFTDELLAKQNYHSAKLELLEAKLQKTAKIYRIKFLANQLASV